MTQTHPTSSRPTFGEMVEEVMDLSIGLVVVGLPFFLLSVPAFVLFIALPAVLILAVLIPLAVVGAVLIGPPVLLARWLRRRRRPTPAIPSGPARAAGRRGPLPLRRHSPA